jgi:DNA polymerase III delta subunit
MLYFLHGDIAKAADKANQMSEAMLKKQPDASRFKLDHESFSAGELEELIGGQGLFSQKYIIDLRRLFEKDESKEIILDKLEDVAASSNIFVWAEGEVDEGDIKLVEKHAEKVQEFKIKTLPKKEDPNLFALGDALGSRDKKTLWLKYVDALSKSDIQPVHGILFWQVKNMLLASKTSSADEAGLSPFPYKKAKQYSNNYSEEELQSMAEDLIAIAHDTRRGKGNFEMMVEKWVLGL